MGKVNEKKSEITSILIDIFDKICIDTPSNFDDILEFVFEDVCETANPVNWHDGDVAIAFRRWIEAQAMSKDEGTECTHGLHIPSYMVEPKSPKIVSLGDTIHRMSELRYLLEGVDNHDLIVIETCDEHGDVIDLYPMSIDIIDDIQLSNGDIVREIRFCQRPNSEPDTRDKQPLVNALIDVLADDMNNGDTTVLDELLMRMPFEVLKYALPEDMWADFEDKA